MPAPARRPPRLEEALQQLAALVGQDPFDDLDAEVREAVAVPSADRPRFVVTHESSVGYFTVLDAAEPSNLEAAYSVRGFLIDDLLGGSHR